MIGYVYVIRNSVNDKVYVGISKQLKVRWDCHRRSVVKGKSKLYSAMRKYGFDKFSIEPFITILDYDKHCDDLEIETVAFFDSFKNGYNSTKGGNVGFLNNPRNRVDYTGKKFGRMMVLGDLPDAICSNGRYNRMVKCRCDCGNERDVALAKLKNGHTESCGCLRLGETNHNWFDAVGLTFGDLTVLKELPTKKSGRWFECMCICGKIKPVSISAIRQGKIKSCGASTCIVDGIKYSSMGLAAKTLGFSSTIFIRKMSEEQPNRCYIYHTRSNGKGLRK